MNQPSSTGQSASPAAPAESKLPPILRAVGLVLLVLLLWAVHKFAVSRAPVGSLWRYIIGATVVAVWLASVILVSGRLASKDS